MAALRGGPPSSENLLGGVTGAQPANPANLDSLFDARTALRARLPHGIFCRKDPFRINKLGAAKFLATSYWHIPFKYSDQCVERIGILSGKASEPSCRSTHRVFKTVFAFVPFPTVAVTVGQSGPKCDTLTKPRKPQVPARLLSNPQRYSDFLTPPARVSH